MVKQLPEKCGEMPETGIQLVRYDAMCEAIDRCESVDEAKVIRDKAIALAAYSKQALNKDAARKCEQIRIRAERRAGELLTESGKNRTRANKGRPTEMSGVTTLSDYGITRDQSSVWQKLAEIPEERFEAELNKPDIPSTNQILQSMSCAHVSHNSGESEWYTPSTILEPARQVLGEIDLDPASNGAAQQLVMAAKFYTAETDGLNREWGGRVWLNPPYSTPLIGKFIDKLAASNVEAFITLTNNATETEWGQKLLGLANAVCFPDRRIRFWNPEKDTSTPLQGQMICYRGSNISSFFENFSEIGRVALLKAVGIAESIAGGKE